MGSGYGIGKVESTSKESRIEEDKKRWAKKLGRWIRGRIRRDAIEKEIKAGKLKEMRGGETENSNLLIYPIGKNNNITAVHDDGS